MYNGIGLQSVRGSGSNGYAQKNLSNVCERNDRVKCKTEDEINEEKVQRTVNPGIQEQMRKRTIELECAELEVKLEIEGLNDWEIEDRVRQHRERLLEKDK